MKWLGSLAFVSIRSILLVLFIVVFVYYLVPRPASFSVAAQTEYLRVDISDINQPDWYLPAVTACVRRAQGETAIVSTDSICGSQFDEHKLKAVDVRFAVGYSLVFRGFEPGFVEVAVNRDDSAADVRLDGFDKASAPASVVLTSGSTLRIPFGEGDRPDIASRGVVVLGEHRNVTAGLMLRSADYEIRQKLGDRTYVVGKGEFLLGDRVHFVRHKESLIGCARRASDVQGFPANLMISSDRRFSAFDVVLTTPNECSAIVVTRIGASPTELPISWTSRLASDPHPAAFATLIGLLGALVGLSNAYLTPRDKDDKKPARRSRKS